MNIKPQLSRAVRIVSATALLGIAYCPSTYAGGERSNVGAAPHYLFICAGDQARQAPDFLAVVNRTNLDQRLAGATEIDALLARENDT